MYNDEKDEKKKVRPRSDFSNEQDWLIYKKGLLTDKIKAIKEKDIKAANQQKIITGSLVLGHCENDVDLAWKVLEILNKKLDDRDKKRMKSVIEALEKIIEVGAVAVPSEQQQTNASTVQ